MEKGFKSGEAQALRIAKEVAEEELKKRSNNRKARHFTMLGYFV